MAPLSTPFNGQLQIEDQLPPGNRRDTSLSLSHASTGYAPSRRRVSLGSEENRRISGVNGSTLQGDHEKLSVAHAVDPIGAQPKLRKPAESGLSFRWYSPDSQSLTTDPIQDICALMLGFGA